MTTIFDQENPGLRDMQAFHQQLDQTKNFDLDIMRNVAYLAEEIGEMVSAMRTLQRADTPSTQTAARVHVGEELADCLAYILKLANYAEVDLQEAYIAKMEKNVERIWKK